jgi:transcriptional regulator with XRE-family HTH domain
MRCSDLGKRLYLARKRSGLTQRALAERSKVSETTIKDIEKERQVPAADTIERLADALKVRACWLAYGEEDGPQKG